MDEQGDVSREASAMIIAVRDGNLGPLAEFLRSGEPFPGWIAHEIAEMIDGNGFFFDIISKPKPRGKGRKASTQGWSHWVEQRHLNRVLAVQFERERRKSKRGEWFATAKEVGSWYGVESTKVTDSHREMNRNLSRMSEQDREGIWQMWFARVPEGKPRSAT